MKKKLILILIIVAAICCFTACNGDDIVGPGSERVVLFGHKAGDENGYFMPIDGVTTDSFVGYDGKTVNADEDSVFFIMSIKGKGDMTTFGAEAKVAVVSSSKAVDFDVAKSTAINGYNVLEKEFEEETLYKLVFNISKADEDEYCKNPSGIGPLKEKYCIHVSNVYGKCKYQEHYHYVPPAETNDNSVGESA